MPIDFEAARHAMVEQQVRPWEVLDPRVLATLKTIRREDFVPPMRRKVAFADIALPLEHGEFMWKPVLEGRMMQSLQVKAQEEVLEIGTGSGFVTACFAHLARAVVSIDRHSDFVERARDRLENLGFGCARVEHADAMNYAPGRQFDAVAVTGAVAELPAQFKDWLRPGGRLFVIRGVSPSQGASLLTRLPSGEFREESLFETDIPYLRGFAPTPLFVL